MAQLLGDPARDEREVTQLVKDLSEAVVKADIPALERLLHADYVHHRPRGTKAVRSLSSPFLTPRSRGRRGDSIGHQLAPSLRPRRRPGIRSPAMSTGINRKASAGSIELHATGDGGVRHRRICIRQ